MADHAELRNTLWDALQAEPKPVTKARALAVARKTLPHLEATQFAEWMKKHGDRLMEKING